MSRKKQKRIKGPHERKAKVVRRLPTAKQRNPVVFAVLDDAVRAAFEALKTSNIESDFEQFQLSIFNRAINGARSIRCLLKEGHWEGSAGIARQLLEITLNLEYIFVKSVDPESSALKFMRYGLLQQALQLRTRHQYSEKLGLQPADINGVADNATLAADFAEFVQKHNSDGSIRWFNSWCRKSVRQMAKESPNPARMDQYDLLYSMWSEQVHGSPGALMATALLKGEPEWAGKLLHEENKKIAEIVGNTVNILCEIWIILPLMRPAFDKEKGDLWLKRVNESQIGPWPTQ